MPQSLTPKTYARPTDQTNLMPLCEGYAFAEHRGTETLFWPDDWYEATGPLCTLPFQADPFMAEAVLMVFLAGEARGMALGLDQGFSNCQAGLRAVLGAVSAADVTALLGAGVAAQLDAARPSTPR